MPGVGRLPVTQPKGEHMRHFKVVTLLLVAFLPSSIFAQSARNIQTIEGIVVDRTGGIRWQGIVVESQGRRYEVPINDAANPEREPKVVRGDIWNTGTSVRVTYYTSKKFVGIIPTSVVEVNNSLVAQRATRGSASAGDWQSFWSSFRAAVRNRNRNKLETLMSRSFVLGGGMLRTRSERISFLNDLSKSEWGRLDVAIRQGAVFDSGCDCRATNAGVRLEFRLENGKWRWVEAWFSGN